MPTKQLVIVIAVVALLSAGLGVVVTSFLGPREVTVSLDLGGEAAEPKPPTAAERRIEENERAVIETLWVIGLAQQQFQYGDFIDTDSDNGGEFGYLAELAGTVPLRAGGGRYNPPMDRPMLAATLGQITRTGAMLRNGYVFKLYLPGPLVNDKMDGLGEAEGGGCTEGGPYPDRSSAELIWCAYAWPVDAGSTGQRAFFVNQEVAPLETPNAEGRYSGEACAPRFDAAYSSESPRDMYAYLALDRAADANDGGRWSRLPTTSSPF